MLIEIAFLYPCAGAMFVIGSEVHMDGDTSFAGNIADFRGGERRSVRLDHSENMAYIQGYCSAKDCWGGERLNILTVVQETIPEWCSTTI